MMRAWDDIRITMRGDLSNATWADATPNLGSIGWRLLDKLAPTGSMWSAVVWTLAAVPMWLWFGLVASLAALSFQSLPNVSWMLGLVALIVGVLAFGDAIERLLTWTWPGLRVLLIIGAVLALLYPFVVDILDGKAWGGESGLASVYFSKGDKGQNGTTVACPGRSLNDAALTAAHRTLPCGSKVKVTNQKNGRTVEVTIIDRGPFVAGRIIDLTKAAASVLGFSGLAPVTLERVGG